MDKIYNNNIYKFFKDLYLEYIIIFKKTKKNIEYILCYEKSKNSIQFIILSFQTNY